MEQKQWMRLKNWWPMLATVAFGLLAHGMRFANMMFSHDSLLVYQYEPRLQISLGRFLQPVYMFVRGPLCAPWLIGCLALLWTGLAAMLLIHVFGFQGRGTKLLVCAVLTVNAPFTYTSSTYIPWLDIFMLSFLFCAVSVFVFARFRFGSLLGAIPLGIMMGLYQSYFQVAVGLYMILVVRDLLDGKEPKAVFLTGVKAIGTLLLGTALYYVSYRLVLLLTGVAAADTYNSISGVGDFAGYSVLELLGEACSEMLTAFLEPETYGSPMVAGCNVILLLLLCLNLGRICWRKKQKPLNVLMLCGILALLPLGVNVVYVIAKGVEHTLMTYSFVMIYVFVLMVQDRADTLVPKSTVENRLMHGAHFGVLLITVAVIWCNGIFTQQVYLKKELNYESTMAAMNRVIDRMEQVEGYVMGVTPVAFVGNLDDVGTSSRRVGYESIRGMEDFNTSITYYETYQMYFQNILGYPIQLVPEEKMQMIAETETVQQMSKFPAADCCKMVEDVLVVKLR